MAKTLECVSKNVDAEALEHKVRPSLSALLQDKDEDVQYFANRAMSQLPVCDT